MPDSIRTGRERAALTFNYEWDIFQYTVQETYTLETGTTTGLAYLYVTVEAAAANNPSQEVYVYNVTTAAFDKLGANKLTTTDSTINYTVVSPVKYATSTGQVKILVKVIGGTKYDHKVDLVKLATQVK